MFRYLRLVTRRRGWVGLSIRMSSFFGRGGREIREEERREESVLKYALEMSTLVRKGEKEGISGLI